MKETVGKRATDPFVEEDEHEADLGAFVSEAIGVVMAIAHDQSPRFHLSEIIPELGKGIGSFRQSVGLEDSLMKHGGGEALDLVGGMEQDFHQAHHPGILNLDAGCAGPARGNR